MRGLTDKVAVIAGGGSGIGAATARRLAEEGAAVVVGDLLGDNAEAIAAEVRAGGGRAVAVQFDITVDEEVGALVGMALSEFGGLDHMHANAADLSPNTIGRDSDALTVPLEVFDRTLQVNLRGHLLCTRHALEPILERGGGSIIYTSSLAGHGGEPERPSYAAAKAGLNALARHVASRWGREGVRANTVAPGLVLTPSVVDRIAPEFKEYALSIGRSPRLGRAEDVAALVAFLMSDDAEWINGQVISVDGGTTLRP